MGTLYIVATPIGNLKDITLRAIDVLNSVDIILAEDTRVTKKLLSSYNIRKPVLRYDEKTSGAECKRIAKNLERNKKIALVTDAGTPGISDPGWRLVSVVRKEAPQVSIEPIPGVSSVITALSVSGISAGQFTFLGYVPHKKGRNTFFKELNLIKVTPIVFFESPHRIKKTLNSLNETLKNREIVVARELTKLYEEVWCGAPDKATSHFTEEKERGEFVIIIR